MIRRMFWMEDLIEKFQAPISPTKIEVSETASMAGVVALGNSPACKMFAELRLLAELSVCKDEVLGCNTWMRSTSTRKRLPS